MKQSHALIGSGLLLLLLTAVAAATGWSFHQVPRFYRDALDQQADPRKRQQQAQHLEQRTLRLVDDIYHADEWSQEFTATQINSWLAEELPRHRAHWLPIGVSEPRLHFTENTIHLAFHYRDEYWDAVISVQLKPDIETPDCLAVEFASARAGGIPLPMDDVLAEMSRLLTEAGCLHVWTQRDGNQVILVELGQFGFQQPVLESLQVRPGSLSVAGRRLMSGNITLAELFLGQSEREALSGR